MLCKGFCQKNFGSRAPVFRLPKTKSAPTKVDAPKNANPDCRQTTRKRQVLTYPNSRKDLRFYQIFAN